MHKDTIRARFRAEMLVPESGVADSCTSMLGGVKGWDFTAQVVNWRR